MGSLFRSPAPRLGERDLRGERPGGRPCRAGDRRASASAVSPSRSLCRRRPGSGLASRQRRARCRRTPLRGATSHGISSRDRRKLARPRPAARRGAGAHRPHTRSTPGASVCRSPPRTARRGRGRPRRALATSAARSRSPQRCLRHGARPASGSGGQPTRRGAGPRRRREQARHHPEEGQRHRRHDADLPLGQVSQHRAEASQPHAQLVAGRRASHALHPDDEQGSHRYEPQPSSDQPRRDQVVEQRVVRPIHDVWLAPSVAASKGSDPGKREELGLEPVPDGAPHPRCHVPG